MECAAGTHTISCTHTPHTHTHTHTHTQTLSSFSLALSLSLAHARARTHTLSYNVALLDMCTALDGSSTDFCDVVFFTHHYAIRLRKPRSSLLSVSSACMWRTLGVAVLLFPAISQPFSRALDTGLGNLQAHKRCPSWPSRLVQTKTLDPNAPLTALLLLRGGGGGSEEHSGTSEDGVRAGGGQGPSMWEEEVVQSSKEDDGGSPAKREAKTTEDAEVAVSTEEEEAGTGKAEAEAEAEAEHAAATEEEDSTPSDEGTVSVTASGAKRGRRAAAADGITAGKTPRRGGRGGRSAARAAGSLRPHALVTYGLMH
jgi:hypothetical protein